MMKSMETTFAMMKDSTETLFTTVKALTKKSPTDILGTELNKLKQLHDSGFIDDEIFKSKKQKMLDEYLDKPTF
jgi:hypothetical protein